jgi:hypothetical protein
MSGVAVKESTVGLPAFCTRTEIVRLTVPSSFVASRTNIVLSVMAPEALLPFASAVLTTSPPGIAVILMESAPVLPERSWDWRRTR